MQSGRCLGSVITSSFRASESNVRQFSWVVWRCVSGFGACSDGGLLLRAAALDAFAWCWSLFRVVRRCGTQAAALDAFWASESNVRQLVFWSLRKRLFRGWFVPRVVRRCGSGYIGCRCIWTHLLQMQSGRCLGGGVAVRSRVVRRCGSGYIG